jgi:hypothetical protein
VTGPIGEAFSTKMHDAVLWVKETLQELRQRVPWDELSLIG